MLFDQLDRTGVHTSLFHDEGRLVLRTHQPVAGILEENRQAALAYDPAPERRSGGFRRVAQIPFVVWQQLEQLGIVQGMRVVDERAFLRMLSDPELRFLRTDNGRRLA